MDGPQFMRFAWRIAAYGGMVATRIQAATPVEPAPAPAPTPAAHAPAPAATPQAAPAGNRAAPNVKPWSAFAHSHPDLFERVRVPADAPPSE